VDPRYEKLAELLVGYSTKITRGDIVRVEATSCVPREMLLTLIRAARGAGGELLNPRINDPRIVTAGRRASSDRSLRIEAASLFIEYLGADVNVVLRGYENPFEGKAVPADRAQAVDRIINGLTMSERIDRSRWVLTIWPTPGFAQLLGVSTPEAEDFFFDAVLADYPTMAKAMQPLTELMLRTDRVHIKGPGTDLTFSIKGINVVPCVGERNIPDGEDYTAPVADSVNGTIQYNTLTIPKSGDRFTNVWFRVKDGVIVDERCDTGDLERMRKILNTDPGARRFGEFAIGVNCKIPRVIGDTLFDEKVGGTFHLTPGNAYEEAQNGNVSTVHWDIVNDQREAAGGGEIWFDGKLVRKNGIFTLPELAGLNPPGAVVEAPIVASSLSAATRRRLRRAVPQSLTAEEASS
jgi:aminopeptidase